jgi:hypothetical protein
MGPEQEQQPVWALVLHAACPSCEDLGTFKMHARYLLLGIWVYSCLGLFILVRPCCLYSRTERIELDFAHIVSLSYTS